MIIRDRLQVSIKLISRLKTAQTEEKKWTGSLFTYVSTSFPDTAVHTWYIHICMCTMYMYIHEHVVYQYKSMYWRNWISGMCVERRSEVGLLLLSFLSQGCASSNLAQHKTYALYWWGHGTIPSNTIRAPHSTTTSCSCLATFMKLPPRWIDLFKVARALEKFSYYTVYTYVCILCILETKVCM